MSVSVATPSSAQTPAFPTEDLVARAQPAATASSPTASARRPYEAVLAGQRVRAEPADPLWGVFGQRRWRVTVTSPSEGLLGSFEVDLAAQFGPAQLRRGQHTWQRVQALVAQQKAAPKELRGIDLERLVPVPQNALSRLLVGPKPQADVAAQVARQLGLAVTISKGADGTWRTVLERLPNNAAGGRAWHALSRSPANGMLGVTQGELKLPANASPAFRQAHEQAQHEGAWLDLTAIALTLGSGAGLRPGATPARTRSNTAALAPRGRGAAGGAGAALGAPQSAVQRLLAGRPAGTALAGLRQLQAQGRPFTQADLSWAMARDVAHHKAQGTLHGIRELHAGAQKTAARLASPAGAGPAPEPAAPATPRTGQADAPARATAAPHRGSDPSPGAAAAGARRHVYRQPIQQPQQAQPPARPAAPPAIAVQAQPAAPAGQRASQAGMVTQVDKTSNASKQLFAQRALGSVNTDLLPLIQQPAPDEIAMSTKENARVKASQVGRPDLERPLVVADIAGARGILPADLVAGLHDFQTFGTLRPRDAAARRGSPLHALEHFLRRHDYAPSEQAWWGFLGQAARAHGQRPRWDALRARPVYVFTDDSKTQMLVRGPAGLEPLSFRDLATQVDAIRRAGTAAQHGALLELHGAVRAVASTLKAARAHHDADRGQVPEAPYRDEEGALRWYLDRLGHHGLLGPDGSPIGSLIAPMRLLEALDDLARLRGQGGLHDLVVRSKSVLSASPLYLPQPEAAAPGIRQAVGFADYRFAPLAQLQRRFAQREPVSLDHALVPVEGDGSSVEQLLQRGLPRDLGLLPRGRALEALRRDLRDAGLELPRVGSRPVLTPLDAGDRIAVVLPGEATSAFRQALAARILDAWRAAGALGSGPGARPPRIEFHPLAAMEDAAANAAVRGAAVRYFVSPDLVPGADTPVSARLFTLGLLSDAIDATVGPAALRGNPSFVLLDTSRPASTGVRTAGLLRDLYLEGEVPHPLPAAFIDPDEPALRGAARDHWNRATVRPRTLDVRPLSSPLRPATEPASLPLPLIDHQRLVAAPSALASAAAPYRPQKPALRVALFGSAAEQAPPGVVAATHRVMSAFIQAVGRLDAGQAPATQTLMLRGAALQAVARQVLAVAPAAPEHADSPAAQADHLQRIRASLEAMPAVRVRALLDDPADPAFEISVPQMQRPVIAVHGAGRSRQPMRSASDPVRTVMDGFNLVHPIADAQGRVQWVSSQGVTTPELQLLEGTAPAGSPHVLTRPHELEFARLIVERTAKVSRDTNIAFSFAGRMGTRQEELFYRGLLVVVDPDPRSSSLRRIIALRQALGLPTEVLDSNAPDLAARIEPLARAAMGGGEGPTPGKAKN